MKVPNANRLKGEKDAAERSGRAVMDNYSLSTVNWFPLSGFAVRYHLISCLE